MSDDLALYEAFASALADVREPDLSAFDPTEVREALERVLGSPAARAGFLAWLDARVRALSGGRVSIEERPASDTVTGPGMAAELPVRVVVTGEPFAESAVLRADDGGLHYPMRG